jgi:transposase
MDFGCGVASGEAALEVLADRAGQHGTVGLVTDQPGSIARLALAVARRDALAAEIEETFLAHPFGELLSTLPGIGPRTGSRILAEIGDGTRFADGGRLASYAGLARRRRDVILAMLATRQPYQPARPAPGLAEAA